MMDKLKSIKIDVTLAAVLSVVLGGTARDMAGNRDHGLGTRDRYYPHGIGDRFSDTRLMDEVKSYTSIIVSLLITLIGLWMFLSRRQSHPSSRSRSVSFWWYMVCRIFPSPVRAKRPRHTTGGVFL